MMVGNIFRVQGNYSNLPKNNQKIKKTIRKNMNGLKAAFLVSKEDGAHCWSQCRYSHQRPMSTSKYGKICCSRQKIATKERKMGLVLTAGDHSGYIFSDWDAVYQSYESTSKSLFSNLNLTRVWCSSLKFLWHNVTFCHVHIEQHSFVTIPPWYCWTAVLIVGCNHGKVADRL